MLSSSLSFDIDVYYGDNSFVAPTRFNLCQNDHLQAILQFKTTQSPFYVLVFFALQYTLTGWTLNCVRMIIICTLDSISLEDVYHLVTLLPFRRRSAFSQQGSVFTKLITRRLRSASARRHRVLIVVRDDLYALSLVQLILYVSRLHSAPLPHSALPLMWPQTK